MFKEKFSNREKEGVYRLILLLNSSLQFIVARLEEMAAVKLLNPEYLAELKAMTVKVEAEINSLINPDDSL